MNALDTANKNITMNLIPVRDLNAVSGSVFIQNNINLVGSKRDTNILNEFVSGNIPNFLRNFKPITINNESDSITYFVTSDYLSIGDDSDYVRMPMSAITAKKIANLYDCTLPTKKMVNDIWKNSENKLAPLPWGPPYNSDMEKTHRFGTHSKNIDKQLNGLNKFALTSGHKKDTLINKKILTNKNNTCIYGWHQLNGVPIQGVNAVSHNKDYYDYSQCIRLIANDVVVNGVGLKFIDVIKNPSLCSLVSDEGSYDPTMMYSK